MQEEEAVEEQRCEMLQTNEAMFRTLRRRASAFPSLNPQAPSHPLLGSYHLSAPPRPQCPVAIETIMRHTA
eukprot:COSAG02_NODE_1350_length_13120_cov_4.275555_8_plen_71_part_00